ncbi:hypothetical protein [Burkholderia cenocepacia]|uniref:hypothetical protein n=1 Tax=Burkholderia cenocepacia TaxID=95486 RepID=UPI00123761CE|nr:hypothetical protein [Burkholderia cenocepacia]
MQIDVDALAAPQLCCDEDAYALLDLKRAHPGKSVEELVQHAKDTLPVGATYAAASLQAIGNCGYLAAIPLGAVTCAVAINWRLNPQLTLASLDAVVSPQAYRFVGSYYRQLTQWLFDPSSALQVESDPLTLGMKFPETSAGVSPVWPEPSRLP